MKKNIVLFFIFIFILILTSFQINARYYNPSIGRFITADSVTPGEGSDLQGLNRYSYSLNNPVIYTDPTGHEPENFWRHEGKNPTSPYVPSKFSENNWKLGISITNAIAFGMPGKSALSILQRLSYLYGDTYLPGASNMQYLVQGSAIGSSIAFGYFGSIDKYHQFMTLSKGRYPTSWSKGAGHGLLGSVPHYLPVRAGICTSLGIVDMLVNYYSFGKGTYELFFKLETASLNARLSQISGVAESAGWSVSSTALLLTRFLGKNTLPVVKIASIFAITARIGNAYFFTRDMMNKMGKDKISSYDWYPDWMVELQANIDVNGRYIPGVDKNRDSLYNKTEADDTNPYKDYHFRQKLPKDSAK